MERTGKLLLITSLFLCFFGLKGWTRDRATNQPDSLALHASRLRFVHPITRRDMFFETPIPASFQRLVREK